MLTFNYGLKCPGMFVSKTRNANGGERKGEKLIHNEVQCNVNRIWVSVLRLPVIWPCSPIPWKTQVTSWQNALSN